MRPRNYIGLSCSGHDNALAIVNAAGEVVFAEATERELQSKRALNAAPDDLLRIAPLIERYCAADAELIVCKSWGDASGAAIAHSVANVGQVISRLEQAQATAATARARQLIDRLLERERTHLQLAAMHRSVCDAAGRNLRYRFPERAHTVRNYEHHLTHAAAACFTSPFEQAACVVADGVGEASTLSCYKYEAGRLERIAARDPSSSQPLAGLGLFYADLCSLCGFDHWKGEEWKVMGLSAYGEPDAQLERWFSRCLQLDGLGFVRPAGEAEALARLWQMVDSGNRALQAKLARSGQQAFEQLLFALCRKLREQTGKADLVLSGGCALNSSANGKLLANTGFERLYVPCAPADDGNAVGAALLGYFADHPGARPHRGFQSPYLGSGVAAESLERAAQYCGFARVERMDEARRCEYVAKRLAAGDLVGWMQGRAEFGPRALGNRSILADPRRPQMKDRINQAVKFRERFRPFAPAVLAERAADYFESYQESPYMERSLSFRADVQHEVPAAVHADGSGRLQSVRAEWNPLFHRLLSAFAERSGVPMLINTSFNVMGKPIVHSVEDAIAVFATSGLDQLVIEEYVFSKR